jgi:vancomycin resistance protein VanW
MRFRKYIPSVLRRSLRLGQKKYRDYISGRHKRFARNIKPLTQFPYSIELVQPIRPTVYFENKVHNIREGIRKIEMLIIYPGELFSFWRAVKYPGRQNNYKVGRNLIAGNVSEDYGGGLCQLASIIYHISLIGRLNVLERYSHSVDIYQESDRFILLLGLMRPSYTAIRILSLKIIPLTLYNLDLRLRETT